MVSLLLFGRVSVSSTGISSVRVYSPVFSGFQSIVSSCCPMPETRTVFSIISPRVPVSDTLTSQSAGSQLTIRKGIRNDLLTTPNVGASEAASCMSGSRSSLPTPTANTGTFLTRNADAAVPGDCPMFQSPSDNSTTPRRFGYLSAVDCSAVLRSVPFSPVGGCEENGSITIFIRPSRGFQSSGRITGATASARVLGSSAGACGLLTS